MNRPLLSGFRGVLIYIGVGILATILLEEQVPGSASVIGLIFLLGSMVAFPWIAGRADKD